MTDAIGGLELIASMTTPAVLLLGNAMLVLSTNQRLQAILARLRELDTVIHGEAPVGAGMPGARIPGPLAVELARRQRRRERLAHRALLSFYLSGALFVVMVLFIGASGLGWAAGAAASVMTALLGCLVLLLGVVQLAAETWMGIGATDEQFRALLGEDREGG